MSACTERIELSGVQLSRSYRMELVSRTVFYVLLYPRAEEFKSLSLICKKSWKSYK